MLKAAMWAFLGVGGQQVMRLVVVLVLARLLTPEEFGIVAIAQTILSFAEVLQQMGLGSALIQTDKLSKRMERTAVTAVLATSLAICAVVYIFVGDLARLFQTPELPAIMPVLLASFVLTALNGPSIMLLNREMRFRELAIAQLATYIVGYGAVAVGLALLDFSYWALIWATLVQTVLFFIAAHWLRPVWPTLRPDGSDLKLLFNFGGGMMLAQILNKMARRGDNMIVAATMGSAALGYYSRAYSLMDMANQLFGTVLYKVLFPAFSERRRLGAKSEQRSDNFVVAHFFVAVLMVPGSALTAILAPEIVEFLLGPKWRAAAPVLTVLGAAMYFRLAYKVSGAFVAAEGAVYRSAAVQGIYAALVVAGGLIGSMYGLIGVAVGITVALMGQYLMLTGLAAKLCEVSTLRMLSKLALPILIGVLTAVPTLLMKRAMFDGAEHPLLVIAVVSLFYLALNAVLLWVAMRIIPGQDLTRSAFASAFKRVIAMIAGKNRTAVS